jgi:hypothetical protein
MSRSPIRKRAGGKSCSSGDRSSALPFVPF